MPQKMSISVNGQSQVPPGFRFHPTEEELLQYYLRKKVSYQKIDLDVIREVDLNKLEPWDIQENCKIGSTPQNDWYFFSHKDKKYPTGTRTNRATTAGFWKATGRDKVIYSNSKRIGMRKTLVFYKGRAPHGQKSDWIMHEYRLEDTNIINDSSINHASSATMGEATQEEGWVVCRIFKKKNHHKTVDRPMRISSITTAADTISTTQRRFISSGDEGTLEQILYMERRGRTNCKEEDDEANINSRRFLSPINTSAIAHNCRSFMKLPSLESPNSVSSSQQLLHTQMLTDHDATMIDQKATESAGLNDWVAIDQLVASHLNCQSETSEQLQACFTSEPANNTMAFCTSTHNDRGQLQQLGSSSNSTRAYQDYNNEFDLWSFARFSAEHHDPLQICHMPNAPPV